MDAKIFFDEHTQTFFTFLRWGHIAVKVHKDLLYIFVYVLLFIVLYLAFDVGRIIKNFLQTKNVRTFGMLFERIH